MPRKLNIISSAEVHVSERVSKRTGKVRFVLRYTINGKHEFETLKNLPAVKKGTQEYRDARTQARLIASERETEIRNDQFGYSLQPKVLLKDWFEKCAERKRKNEREGINRHTQARTIENTGEAVEQFRSHAKLGDVDKNFVLGFIDFLKNRYVIPPHLPNAGKKLKPSTADKKVSTFSSVLKMAVEEGLIARNPFNQLSNSDKIIVPESEREYLTKEELKRLSETPITNEATRQVYLFMCFCGLRISDVKALKWGKIEITEKRWRIRMRQKKTQTPHYLPLSEQAKAFLPKRGDKTDDDYVFDMLPSEPAMNRTLKEWAKSADINKNLTLHTSRHTFATLLLDKGADLYTASKLLGHSDIRTTQIYAKVIDKKKEEAVDMLNGILD